MSNGQTSNHGMSAIKGYELMTREEREEKGSTSGRKVECPNCSASFIFNKNDYDAYDMVRMQDFLRHECPYCNEGWKKIIQPLKANILKWNFNLGGRIFSCIRKPAGLWNMRKALTWEQQVKAAKKFTYNCK